MERMMEKTGRRWQKKDGEDDGEMMEKMMGRRMEKMEKLIK